MNTDPILVGRHKDLVYLCSEWHNLNLLSVSGMKSIGKTCFVKEFLNQRKNKNCLEKFIWVDLKNTSKLRYLFLVLWENLSSSELPEDQEQFLPEICQMIHKDSDQIVIILDGAEEMIVSSYGNFVQVCCSLIHCSMNIKLVVISSTKLLIDTKDFQYLEITLPPLSLDESKKLLVFHAPNVDFRDSLDTIAQLCEGLPLALLMTAVELRDRFLVVEEMLELLMRCRLDVLSQDAYPQQERIASVYGQFLKKLSDVFRSRLATLNYIPGSFNVQQARGMIGHSTEEEAFVETINPILQRQMLQHDAITRRFNIHGILRDCINVFFHIRNLPEVRRRFCCIFSDIMMNIGKKMDTQQYTEALCLYNQEQQNFQKLLTDVIYTKEDTYCMYMGLALNAFNAIEIFMASDGFQFYRQLIDLTVRNERKIDGACVKIRLGSTLTNVQGNLKQGEIYYTSAIRTLEEYKKISGNTLTNVYHGMDQDCRLHLALGYQRIGWNLGGQGRFRSAIVYLEKALELETELGMYNKELILSSIQSLGVFHTASGNPEEGLKYHFEALKRRRSLYGSENHPYIGSCMNNIGLAFQSIGDVHQSFKYFSEGLQIKRTTKANDKSLAISIKNVALSLSGAGRHSEGITILEEAYQLLRKHPGCYYEILCNVHAAEGQILIRVKQFNKAIQSLKLSISIREQYAPNTICNCECYLGIGKAFFALSRRQDALIWLEKVHQDRMVIRSENPTCPFVLDGYEATLEVYFDLNNADGVATTYNNALQEIDRLQQAFMDLGNVKKTSELTSKRKRLRNKYGDPFER